MADSTWKLPAWVVANGPRKTTTTAVDTTTALERRRQRDRARAPLTYTVRMELITKADHHCIYCGAEGDRRKWIGPDGKSWHLDHWVPLSRGGSLDVSNVVIACTACNGTKGTLAGGELVEWLLQSEGTPAWTEHRARMLAHLLGEDNCG